MAEERVKCLAAGCTEYLSKPIDRQKLLMTCSNYLRADIYPFKPADEKRQHLKSEIFNLKSQLELAGIQPPSEQHHQRSHEIAEESMQSLRSNLANDPRVMRVLDRFISNLPDRVAELQNSLNDGNLDLLRNAIHNLKGAGSGYGFPAITQKSASAEEALKAQRSLDEIRREVSQLIGLIQRVDGYDARAAERETESRTQEEFAL
jgi:HPt (histidine-containing phosphotransfer) domain-containing protein